MTLGRMSFKILITGSYCSFPFHFPTNEYSFNFLTFFSLQVVSNKSLDSITYGKCLGSITHFMEGKKFPKKAVSMAERVNYTKNNIINYRIKYVSECVLQLYIKIHLCSGVTNNILRKIHKKLQIM